MTGPLADDETPLRGPVDRGGLRLAGPVGNPGAVGVVHKVEGGIYYYKEYFESSRQAARLRRLIQWRDALSPDERAFLDAHCSWPLAAVTADHETVGFLMRPAPDDFWADMLGETHTLELQHLIHSATAQNLDIPVLSPAQRLALVGDLAGIFAFFDRHGIIYGDVSETNVLWTAQGSPRVYLIDCDNARPADFTQSGAGVAKARNDSWRDPDLAEDGLPGVSSDRYALGVFCYRVFYGVTASLEGGQAYVLLPENGPHLPDLEQLLAAALGDPARRPPAASWIPVIAGIDAAALEAAPPAKRGVRDKAPGRSGSATRPPWRGWRPRRLGLVVAASVLTALLIAALLVTALALAASPQLTASRHSLAGHLAAWEAGPVKIAVPHYNAFVQQTGKAPDRWAYVNTRVSIRNLTARPLNLSHAPTSLVLVVDTGFNGFSQAPIVPQQVVTGIPARLHLYTVGFSPGPWTVSGPGHKARNAGWKAGLLQPGRTFVSLKLTDNSAIYQLPPPSHVELADGESIAPVELHILGIGWLGGDGQMLGFSPVAAWSGQNSIKDFFDG